MAERCSPLVGCEAADLSYCVMLGAECQAVHLDREQVIQQARERSVSLQRYAAHAVAGWTHCKGARRRD